MSSREMHKVILVWGPVLAVMAILFFASAQPKHEIPGKEETIYFSGAVPIFPGGWDFLIKKSSHVLVYGVLAALTLRALKMSGQRLPQAAYLAVVIAVCYAVTDEYHQSFIVGRSASMMDIGFDLLGAVLACGILTVWAQKRPSQFERRVSQE